ncbi:hypothetical protein PX701_04680 [Agromyces sp. H3Y2-19a]|uniref:hypothetical protein n=1 Tax=Agromyces chromiiresistens TaxID=3030835 RepID=UPI0023B9641B|nr:hypothetical protein [Agromyces chromiiresistens]MDF0512910.1 hypothetical protein [Agromyces chromiiresistens]
MISEKPENRMPLSHPARVADAAPAPAEAVERGLAPLGFALEDEACVLVFDGFAVDDDLADREEFALDRARFASPASDAGPFADDAGSEASALGFDLGTREPAGFAGLRGVRDDSPFIALLMTARNGTTGAATRPPSSRCRYAITP